MPSSSSSRFSLNVPRLILWIASIVIAVIGYIVMVTANANEAAVYTKGTADYPKLFAAQSASTEGGFLVAVGVLGLLLALTSMAITWRARVAPEAVVLDAIELDETDLDDDSVADAPVAESVTDSDAPVVR